MISGDRKTGRAPVALLIFNRPETTARVFDEVRKAEPERLLVVADGPREGVKGEADRCARAREITEQIDWQCEVSREYSETNLGCRRRISSGIDWVFDQVEEAIILEDDCLPDPSFFPYCEELLDRYRDEERVMHISGDNLRFGRRGDASYFFSQIPHVWGWATWRSAWSRYDLDVRNWSAGDKDRYLAAFDDPAERAFWQDIWDRTSRAEIDTWDFSWVFACVASGGLAINPNVNLVTNIGFGEGATNTEEDPGELANLPRESLSTPLRHPQRLERDRECDAETGRRFFSRHEPPLKVCIDARLGAGKAGGVEQIVIGLAAALSKLDDGNEEYLFLTNAGDDDWIRPYLAGPCRVLHTRRSRAERFLRNAGRGLLERVPKLGLRFSVRPSDGTVERNGIDVIHFPFQDAFFTGVPSIYQPHDLQHLHLPELFSEWQRARREVVYRMHCERAATVVSMTEWGKRDLIEQYGLAPEKVAVVPGGSVLWEYPEPSAADLEELRARLSLPDSFLLYPAQTWQHKNHGRLLEAIALLRDREGVSVALVCPGRQTAHFRRIQEGVSELGLEQTTWFPGFVSPLELRALYQLATGLVFPSRFEGWGLPVCEAFSAGLPVASSTATSLPGLVGDAGLLFDPDDTEDMAAKVLELWTDEALRRTLAVRGRERSEEFTFERAARIFRAHYRRIGQRPLSEQDRILSGDEARS